MKIKFNYNGQEYSLRLRLRLTTFADIFDKGGHLVSSGMSIKNPDGLPLNERLGDRIAIGRALVDGGMDKGDAKRVTSELVEDAQEEKDYLSISKARAVFQKVFGQLPPSLRMGVEEPSILQDASGRAGGSYPPPTFQERLEEATGTIGLIGGLSSGSPTGRLTYNSPRLTTLPTLPSEHVQAILSGRASAWPCSEQQKGGTGIRL